MGSKDLQCIRHSPLFCVCYFDSPWLGQEKNFHNKGSQMGGKCCFEIDFCLYSIL